MSVEYASFLRRLSAVLLDSLVWLVGLSFFPWGLLISTDAGGDSTVSPGATIVLVLILSAWFNYFAFCEWRWGQTIGKNAFGIRVRAIDGAKLGWQAATVRNLMRLVDLPLALIGLDFIIVGRSPRRQRLGDRSAGTLVVRERPPAPGLPPEQPAAARGPDATEEKLPAATVDDPTAATAPGFPFAGWDVRRTLIGLLVGLLLAAVIAPLLVLPFDHDLSSTAAKLAAQGLFELTLIGVALWVVARAAAGVRSRLAALGLRRPRKGAYPWVPFVFFSYIALANIYTALVGNPSQKDIARDLGLDTGVLAALVVFALVAVLAPIAEEIFFRGMLFGGLRKRLGTLPAALISALIFGGLHATTGLSAVPLLAILGFLLALLYERTGSLLPGIILHMINNTIALLLTL